MSEFGFNTELLHETEYGDPTTGATLIPIYQNSAFSHESAEELERIFENKAFGYSYTRINNPTIAAFEKRMTKLEHGLGSVACSSGMAAITNGLLNVLSTGHEILAAPGLYGGTIDLFRDLEAFGIRTRFVSSNTPEAFAKELSADTRIIFAETIGNPKLDVTDIQGLAQVAKEAGILLMIDNTTATGYLIRPLDYGANLVVNSTSKYVNGQGNAISGVITDRGDFFWDPVRYPVMEAYVKYGKMAYLARLRGRIFRNMGACLSPQTAYLNCLGLETLGLRMERQCQNALELAQYLEQLDPAIMVHYPGLTSSPYHALAKQQFSRGFGGILSLRAGSKERAFQWMNRLNIPLIISNIGDTKTLVIHPASTISLHCSPQEKLDSGVYEDLVRISVGIEDIEDLKKDFYQAIKGGN